MFRLKYVDNVIIVILGLQKLRIYFDSNLLLNQIQKKTHRSEYI